MPGLVGSNPLSLTPRPFYIIGHNTNTVQEVIQALNSGANAIEPDVNVYAKNNDQLCISHGEGDINSISLSKYLKELHNLAIKYPQLSLVVFDCKDKVATPKNGLVLLNAIRSVLTYDIKLNIIISVNSISKKAIFENIKLNLNAKEGLMIDEENDPIAVTELFKQSKVVNHCYGNGISVLNDVLGPNVRPSIERACEYRAAHNNIKFIYSWTINNETLMQEYINIGLDGMITDKVPILRNIVLNSKNQTVIRMATRSDNPFNQSPLTYGIVIHTGSDMLSGTDTNINISLNGSKGFSTINVDSLYPPRMETGSKTFVTLYSSDLGDLQSVTVQRDNKGINPDWYLSKIFVESFRFGTLKQATFNMWIGTSPVTKQLV